MYNIFDHTKPKQTYKITKTQQKKNPTHTTQSHILLKTYKIFEKNSLIFAPYIKYMYFWKIKLFSKCFQKKQYLLEIKFFV